MKSLVTELKSRHIPWLPLMYYCEELCQDYVPVTRKKLNSIPDYSLLSFPLKVQSFRPYWAQIKLAHCCYTLQVLRSFAKWSYTKYWNVRLWLFTMETTLTFDKSKGLQVHLGARLAGISPTLFKHFILFFGECSLQLILKKRSDKRNTQKSQYSAEFLQKRQEKHAWSFV